MQLDRILMPTDFSDCAEATLDRAVELARTFGAELHLLHVLVLHDDPQASFIDSDEIYCRWEEVASDEMGRLLGVRQTDTLNIHHAQRRAVAAAPAIVEYAAAENIDLIVIGTHGRRGLRRFLLGSVAEETVRTADRPVLTIHGEDAAKSLESIERIVVPFDFSPDSEAALETAVELARTYRSRIDLVHVISLPIAPDGLAELPVAGATYTDLSETLEQALSEHAATVATPETAIEAHVFYGSPAPEITDFATKTGAGLIVLGSHGLSGLRRFLLGSVSERVVRSAHCPVLILRRPDASKHGAAAKDGAD